MTTDVIREGNAGESLPAGLQALGGTSDLTSLLQVDSDLTYRRDAR